MSGNTTRVQTRTDYSMLATDFAGGKSNYIVVARRVPVDRWRECNIVARVHAITNFNAGSSATLYWALDPYTDEDPAAVWLQSANPSSVAAFTQGTDTMPSAKVGTLTAPFGPLIMFQWKFVMATTPVDMKFSVSIDMNLKGE